MDLVMAIDGGGSGCRAALVRLDTLSSPQIIGRGVSGPSNFASDFDLAYVHILECANLAIESSGVENIAIEELCAVLGSAGTNVGNYKKRMQELLPFKKVLIESDAITALHGALDDRDGIMAAIGTGSVFVKKQGDKVEVKGGWGFQASDLGGGARLGQRLIEYSLLAYDGFETNTPLFDAVLAKFGNDPAKVSSFARDANPKDFAEFAPIIFRYVDAGDEGAIKLLNHQVSEVERHINAIAEGDDGPVCLTGGLGGRYVNYFSHAFKKRVIEPKGTPLDGAILMAQTIYGTASNEQSNS